MDGRGPEGGCGKESRAEVEMSRPASQREERASFLGGDAVNPFLKKRPINSLGAMIGTGSNLGLTALP